MSCPDPLRFSPALLLLLGAFACGKEVDTGDTSDIDMKDARAFFYGELEQDYAGYSVAAAGDVDGDGEREFLVGAYQNDAGGEQAGIAYIVKGGYASEVPLAGMAGRLVGMNAFGWAGYAVAGAGDLNNDGFDDVLVGAPYDSTAGRAAGMAYVVHGIIEDERTLSSANATIKGMDADDLTGWMVSGAGDMNMDGRPDLLIGAMHEISERSLVIVGYAFESPVSGSERLDDAKAEIAGFTTLGETGWSVGSVEDVNGDGFSDFVVGHEFSDKHGLDAGCAWLVRGPIEGTVIVGSNDDYIGIQGEVDGDHAGASVGSAGDMNGDGLTDILVGAPGEDTGALEGGAIYLLFGPANRTIFLGASDAKIVGEKSADGIGRSFSPVGDVDGDGNPDLLVGVPASDLGGSDAGAAYLLFGPFEGQVQVERNWDLIGRASADQAGLSVAGVGDVDGDDLPDFVIGVPYADLRSTDSGAALLFSGSAF
jgi:hypothetical protein